MNKPLTIEQLKALPMGEWLYIKVEDGAYPNTNIETGYFRTIPNYKDDRLWVGTTGYGCFFKYDDYGTTWLAYKNKEAAEGKDDEIRKQMAKEILQDLYNQANNQWQAIEWTTEDIKQYAKDKHGVEVEE